MSLPILTRFTWTDDSGAGLDGTILNNAQLQAIFDAVDEAIQPIVQIKTAAYTAVVTDDVIKATSGTWTLTLFTAVGNDGKALEVRNAGSGIITVDPDGAQTIDGAATVTLSPGEYLRIRSDGANWITTGKVGTALRQAFRGLRLSTSLSNADEANKVTLRALDEVVMSDGSRYLDPLTAALDADITAAGAGGLDTGARTASRWYEIWLIGKSSTLSNSDLRLLLHLAKRWLNDTSFTTTSDANRYLRIATGTPTDKIAQGFQLATAGRLPFVELAFMRQSATPPTGNVWVTIEADTAGNPSGVALATSDKLSFAGFATTNVEEWVRFTFPAPPTLSATTQYHIVLQGDFAKTDTDSISWRGVVAGGYASGVSKEFNGGTWAATAGANGLDRLFRAYVEIPSPALTYPAGYDHGCRLGFVYNNGSNVFVPFMQVDKHVTGYQTSDYRAINNSFQENIRLTDLSAVIPPVPVTLTQLIAVSTGALAAGVRLTPTPFISGFASKHHFFTTFAGGGAITFIGSRATAEHQACMIQAGSSGGGLLHLYATGWEM